MLDLRGILRSGARKVVFPAVELLWTVGFRMAGALLRPRLRLIAPAGGIKVLVLAPHPDDETIGCGGAIASHLRAGDDVTVCIVTDGAQSKAGKVSAEEMKARRKAEAVIAMQRLGGPKLCQLELPEGTWTDSELVESLVAMLAGLNPDVIYTTSTVDYHPDHIRVATCLAKALQASALAGTLVRLYEVQVPLTPILANTHVSTVREKREKDYALRAYVTQWQTLAGLRRLARYQQGLYSTGGSAEIFCELTTTHFVALTQNVGLSYFGLQPRPFTDPAAWIMGFKARRRMRTRLGID
ncbi:MAG TPA: PIG-L deacetylase family protein [Chloroflexia bacterium]|nr:PIG-L deacetylase family protein [Chloroflexia bacterium]